MARLPSLFAWISQSAGEVLNAVFGWAARALFGSTSSKENTFLSALLAAAVVWSLLLVGSVSPKVTALVLAFFPIQESVSDWPIRLLGAGMVLAVPSAVGLAVARHRPAHLRRRSFPGRLLSGFPLTLGLAIAFALTFATVPFVRLAMLRRGRRSARMPLVTGPQFYQETASLCVSTMNAHGFDLRPAKPAWWTRVPLEVLRFLSDGALAAYIPDRIEHFAGSGLELSFYPGGVLVRGRGMQMTWAQGLIAEATVKSPGLQTASASAQRIEAEIKRVWRVYSDKPEAHANSPFLLVRAWTATAQLANSEIPFDDWQVLYRQLLQLERSLRGGRQLLETQSCYRPAQQLLCAKLEAAGAEGNSGERPPDEQISHEVRLARAAYARAVYQEVNVRSNNDERKDEQRLPPPPSQTKRSGPPLLPGAAIAAAAAASPTTVADAESGPARPVQDLSNVELVKEITGEVTRLAKKEIELAKTELRANFKAEAILLSGLSIAALSALCAVNLLLVTAVFALALVLPGWGAGLIVSGITMAAAALVAWVSWSKRVRKPMERTQRTLKDGVQWTKERLV